MNEYDAAGEILARVGYSGADFARATDRLAAAVRMGTVAMADFSEALATVALAFGADTRRPIEDLMAFACPPDRRTRRSGHRHRGTRAWAKRHHTAWRAPWQTRRS